MNVFLTFFLQHGFSVLQLDHTTVNRHIIYDCSFSINVAFSSHILPESSQSSFVVKLNSQKYEINGQLVNDTLSVRQFISLKRVGVW